ncbi:hypothetical protein [Nocardia noduli]|uniref:hypothetical protein n=1 Tax=Nocardia noduli TaxID=2815722 RepID=UPI001C230093|nr:hypothetical protein [Nocardia noduli]
MTAKHIKTAKTYLGQQDPSDEFTDVVVAIAWFAVKAAARSVWWALLFPMLSIPFGAAVAVWLVFGWLAGVVVVVVGLALLTGWRLASPATFGRWVTDRVRQRFVAWLRYRRRWVAMSAACGLQVTYGQNIATPRLVSIRVGEFTDRVTLRMLPGQCPADYTARTTHLAHAFGVLECRAVVVGPSTVELAFRHHDSLATAVAVPSTRVEWLWDRKNGEPA